MHPSSRVFLGLDSRSIGRTYKTSTTGAMMIIIRALFSLETKIIIIKEEVNLDSGEIETQTMQGVANPKEVRTEIIKVVTIRTEHTALLTIRCS